MQLPVYPATPTGVREEILQPTAAFKKEVANTMGALLFFAFVYVLLMIAAVALAVGCGFAGFMLIVALPKLITLMVGIGLIGLGIMVLIFLLKFLFKSNKVDRSHLVEITAASQPELFAFIKRLTSETQTPFPKRIYISPEVNASVFYDSSFWSMFLPVRKNLQIGLGLVNAVNLSEFKAILAHEFGHFSQRSMKLGSYVYNVNKVIHNMLYDNDGYSDSLQSWANVSQYFAFFAGFTVKIVQGIQSILQSVYGVVNKRYMGLSRQMEFHADTVAACVSGGNHLVNALRRLEIADGCYQRLFGHYSQWYKENLKADNIYPQHGEIMKHYAIDHGLEYADGLPQVTAQSFLHAPKSRLVIKNQWASHPSTGDREAHLNSLAITTETVGLSAWSLFANAEKLQEEVTGMVYGNVEFKKQPDQLDLHSFRAKFYKEASRYRLQSDYKNFYTNRDIKCVDVQSLEINEEMTSRSIEDILGPDIVNINEAQQVIMNDLEALRSISAGSSGVESFEFDGRKYGEGDASSLMALLQSELDRNEQVIEETDRKLISFFLCYAAKVGQEVQFKKEYEKMFTAMKRSDDDFKIGSELENIAKPFFSERLSIEGAVAIARQIQIHERPMRDRIVEMLADSHCAELIGTEDRNSLELFATKERQYFEGTTFLEEEFNLFVNSLILFRNISSERRFTAKKHVLDWQLTIYSNKPINVLAS